MGNDKADYGRAYVIFITEIFDGLECGRKEVIELFPNNSLARKLLQVQIESLINDIVPDDEMDSLFNEHKDEYNNFWYFGRVVKPVTVLKEIDIIDYAIVQKILN